MAAPRGLSNRRGAYRVRPDSVDELDVALLEKRYRVVRGRVTDIACGGAQVEFGPGAASPLARGDRVELALASERFDFDTTLWARIVARSETAKGQVVRLSFEDERLDPATERFFELFNRRARYRRIDRDAETGLDARVAPDVPGSKPPDACNASIRNISPAGVSFAVDSVTDSELRRYPELLLSLRLPNREGVQAIRCRARHHTPGGDLVYYGCEFDWSGDTASIAIAEDLVAYVNERFEDRARLAPDRRDRRR